MPTTSIRIGVLGVSISKQNGTLLPSASGVSFTATGSTPISYLSNDVNKLLATGTAYQVALGFVGYDTINGGYTITQTTSASPAVTPTTGQAILVNIPVANIPSGLATPLVAVFLKQGSGNYQLCDFAYINPSFDFNHMITNLPLQTAPGPWAIGVLTGGTVDPTLGSRQANGYTFTTLSPTTGGTLVDRQVSIVTVSPDTSSDYQITTTRTAALEFNLLPNDIVNIVQGNAGTEVQYTSPTGHVITEGQMSLNTAQAIISGNLPLQVLLPPDALGNQETRIYVGQLLQNQEANQEQWSKTNPTPIKFRYNAVATDLLTISMHTEVQFKTT